MSKGLNVTADSFYSSQGRVTPQFWDDNQDLIARIHKMYPDAQSLEMETFVLFHLAASCRKDRIYAAGCAMVFADRISNDFISKSKVEQLEAQAGRAVLESIVDFPLPPSPDSIA